MQFHPDMALQMQGHTLHEAASCRLNSRTGKSFGKEDFSGERCGAHGRNIGTGAASLSGQSRIYSAIRLLSAPGFPGSNGLLFRPAFFFQVVTCW